MKKVASIDAVRRLALATGAKAEIGGEVFNAAQMRVDLPAAPTAPKPVASVAPPVPASPAHVTRAELEQLIADRDTFWMQEMQRVTQAIASSIAALAANGAPAKSFPNGARFQAVYHRGGELDYIDAKPLPAGAAH